MATHLYKVNQNVALTDGAGIKLDPTAVYTIVAMLPERGSELQYRVKGEHERFERVVAEFQIASVFEPASLVDG